MKKYSVWLLATFIFLNIALEASSQKGYEIKVKIPALKDSTIILAHYFAKDNQLFPDDTAKISKNGTGIFKGTKPLTKGIYLVYLPTKRFIEFVSGENQNFTIEADTSDLLKKIKFVGSSENSLFYEYRNFRISKGEVISRLRELVKKNSSKNIKDSVTKEIEKINKEVEAFTLKIINEHPDLYISKFLKMLHEIEIPEYPRSSEGLVLDSSFRYRYVRKHYFDNFDYMDPGLLRTPLYEQKLTYYFENIVPPWPDSINAELNTVLSNVKNNQELFRYVLGTFYIKYGNSKIMGHDAIMVNLAQNWYLPHATWLDSTTRANMAKDINKLKHNLIGLKAPEIPIIEVPNDHFMLAKQDTAVKSDLHLGSLTSLHNINAEFLILAFWEVDCGHCQRAMPLLYDSVYQSLKEKGVEVLAIHMITSIAGKRKWVDFVNNHNMYDWINAVPYGYEYKELYNAYTLPCLYILDKNKKIIAKQIGVDQIKEIIEMEIRKKHNLAEN